MDSIELTLQLLSTIFTVLGVIVAVSGMDTRWSLAAVLGRRIQGRNIDWEGERRRWREMYDIENQGAFLDRNQYEDHGEPEDIDPSSQTWSALSDATIAVKEYTKFNVELDGHDQESDTKVNSTALKTLNNRQPTRSQQSQHDRQRKPVLVMWPRGRRSGAREATTSKAPWHPKPSLPLIDPCYWLHEVRRHGRRMIRDVAMGQQQLSSPDPPLVPTQGHGYVCHTRCTAGTQCMNEDCYVAMRASLKPVALAIASSSSQEVWLR